MTQETFTSIVAIATGTAGLTAFLLVVVRQLAIDHRAHDAELRTERDLARAERDELRTELDEVRAEVVAALRDSNSGLEHSADGLARLAKVVDKNAAVVDKLVREARVVKP